MLLQVGEEVERYTVEALLGRGAMAEVYRVQHRTLKTKHALKVLMLSGAKIRDRLIQEGQVQAQIRHPNVLSVTDVLDVKGAPGLLMELVAGPTLEEWLHTAKPTPEQAEAMFRGVLAGVSEAHSIGLVHRDLKPANVLVASSSRGPVPKVADFGLAKVLADADGTGDGLHRTRSGSAMGTPAYMAPEQIRDAKRVDHRADIFSLGCILYELTSGKLAFQGDDVLVVFNRVVAGNYAPLRDAPERVQRAISGALLVDRDQRIPSCEVLEEVLLGSRTTWADKLLPRLIPAPEPLTVVSETLVPTPLEQAALRNPVPSGTWIDDDGAEDAPAPASPAAAAGAADLDSVQTLRAPHAFGAGAAAGGAGLAVAAAGGGSPRPAPAAPPPSPPPAPPGAPGPRGPVDSGTSLELDPGASVSLAPREPARAVAAVAADGLAAPGVAPRPTSPGGTSAERPRASGFWRFGLAGAGLFLAVLLAVRVGGGFGVRTPFDAPGTAPTAPPTLDAPSAAAEPSAAAPAPALSAAPAGSATPATAPIPDRVASAPEPAGGAAKSSPKVAKPAAGSTPAVAAGAPKPSGGEAPAPVAGAAPAAKPTSGAVGRLSVLSFPPGTIFVDGVSLGPRFAGKEFSAGRHEIEIRGPEGKVARRTVTVPEGKLTNFCWEFAEDDECN